MPRLFNKRLIASINSNLSAIAEPRYREYENVRHRSGFAALIAALRDRLRGRTAADSETTMRISSVLVFCVLSASTAPACAADPSAASRASVYASAQIIDGSAVLIGAGSELTLASVEVTGTIATLVLRSAVDGASVSLRVSAQVGRVLAHAIGHGVDVSATSAGHLLMIGGEAIAFVLDPATSRHHHRRAWP